MGKAGEEGGVNCGSEDMIVVVHIQYMFCATFPPNKGASGGTIYELGWGARPMRRPFGLIVGRDYK